MSNLPLPKHSVDPRKLASQGAEILAVEAVSSFGRLAGLLANDSGTLNIKLTFSINPSHLVCIDGHIVGQLQVPCQRCMEAMPLEIDSYFSVAVVKNDEQAARIPHAYEPALVNEDGELELLQIVEDELILCVPYTNYHEPEDCAVQVIAPNSEPSEAAEERNNPFTVLAGLIRKTGDKT